MRNAIWLIAATAAIIATASTARPRPDPRGSGRYQASASGITTRAPAASPSHQVRATFGHSLAVITSPARSESGPMMALIAVARAIVRTSRTMPPRLSSGGPRATRRRISTAATSTSAMFPTVWPSAEPSGSTE